MEKFRTHIPIEFTKGEPDKNGKIQMFIKGVASTASKDDDGEILEPKGFDLSYFINRGHINWNHQANKDPLTIIGEPVEAKIEGNKMVVKGMLYTDNEMAQRVYKLGSILEKSGSMRRLGFSIEGSVLERDVINPKRITKAKIKHLAVALSPKNHDAVMEIVKSDSDFDDNYDPDEVVIEVRDGYEKIILKGDMSIEITKIENEDDIKDGIRKAIVIISDGYKQGIVDDDTIELVRDKISSLGIGLSGS